jgi:ATP-binding cassette subfamily F protein 3
MISVEGLTKSYGARVLFQNISFQINPREKVGLVGRNGHGKTTLLRLLASEEPYESGRIQLPRQYRVATVRQQIDFTRTTVLDECMTGLPEEARDQFWKAEKILAGLGFASRDFKRPPAELSGGYQVRLNLAKALLAEPDLLLLDEPTNYLDITSVRWVAAFFQSWPHELLLITHDRGFMDQVVTHVLGIHRQRVRKIKGDTGKYYAQIAQEEEIYEKTRLNDEKRRHEIEQFITRFRAKARLANLVQSRIKTLAKTRPTEKLAQIQNLDFSFRHKPFQGRCMLRVDGLTFGYEAGAPLIEDLSFALAPGERLCVIGPNGRGKTTLLKLLAGRLQPLAGRLAYNPNVAAGYFEQTNVDSLQATRTVEEEILYAHPDVDRSLARAICGAMLFSGEDALKKIAVLSGGEKSRIMLGKLLAQPLNLLLIDEPTNHLDMESCDALLAALDAFAGAVVMVTHNEMFLKALADRLIVFQNEGAALFEGSYQDFLERGGWRNEAPPTSRASANRSCAAGYRKKELRRARSAIITARAKALAPLKKELARTEARIDAREQELAGLQQEMQQATQHQQPTDIARLSQAMHACEQEIERLFDRLEAASAELEAAQARFEDDLQRLQNEEASG